MPSRKRCEMQVVRPRSVTVGTHDCAARLLRHQCRAGALSFRQEFGRRTTDGSGDRRHRTGCRTAAAIRLPSTSSRIVPITTSTRRPRSACLQRLAARDGDSGRSGRTATDMMPPADPPYSAGPVARSQDEREPQHRRQLGDASLKRHDRLPTLRFGPVRSIETDNGARRGTQPGCVPGHSALFCASSRHSLESRRGHCVEVFTPSS